MAKIIELNEWRARKVARHAPAPALACPTCEAECKAVNTTADGSTVYRCTGHGHRALTWRIDAEGNMLRGSVGRRFY